MANKSLDERINEHTRKSSASMVPEFTPPPPPKEEEHVPDLREVVASAADRLTLARLIEQSAELAKMERQIKKEREPITSQIKKLLGKHEVGKCTVNGILVNYYNSPRSSLSRELLLSHNVKPEILQACTVVKDSYTLRITPAGESEDE